jgi:hypothetical protein
VDERSGPADDGTERTDGRGSLRQAEEAGIPSFYKDMPVFAGGRWGGSGVNPAVPVEIYVNPDDLEQARQLLV